MTLRKKTPLTAGPFCFGILKGVCADRSKRSGAVEETFRKGINSEFGRSTKRTDKCLEKALREAAQRAEKDQRRLPYYKNLKVISLIECRLFYLYESYSFLNTGNDFFIISVGTQYASLTQPGQPKLTPLTSSRSKLLALSQKASVSSSSAFRNR